MKTALLVVDLQNDYFPGGTMELVNSTAASVKVRELLELFRNKKMPVIHIQHISARLGAAFFLPGTHGAEFHENGKPLHGEKVIVKHYPNSFRDTELDKYLKNESISKLIITGMMTQMCIDTTVRVAFDLGYECMLASEGCATRDLVIDNAKITAENVQLSFLAALNGLFAKVVKNREIIELLQ